MGSTGVFLSMESFLQPAISSRMPSILIGNLVITPQLIGRVVAIRLVHTDANLFDTQQAGKLGALAGHALDLAGLLITLRNRYSELVIGRDHDGRGVSLRSPSKHVLDWVFDFDLLVLHAERPQRMRPIRE